jgi:hypothetical protein
MTTLLSHGHDHAFGPWARGRDRLLQVSRERGYSAAAWEGVADEGETALRSQCRALSFILEFYSMDLTRPYAIARSFSFGALPNRGGEWRCRGCEMLRDLDLSSPPAFSFARMPASAGFDEIGAPAPPSVAGFEGDFEAIDQILAANDHVIEPVCQRLPGLCGNVQSLCHYSRRVVPPHEEFQRDSRENTVAPVGAPVCN